MPGSVDIGTFSCTIVVDTGTFCFFVPVSLDTGAFPVWQFRSLLGRFTYQSTLLYSSYTDPHIYGFSERVNLKHDPTMLREL